MAAIIKMAAMRRISVFFLFPFIHWPFSLTKKNHRYWSFLIYISEYWHEIWDIYYAFALFLPIYWPQIVNFVSPNYAQPSVFAQIKFIGSLSAWLPWAYFLCFSISFSSLTFFIDLVQFCKVHSALYMSECSCFHFKMNQKILKKVK